MERKMNIELNWFLDDKDDDVEVKVQRQFKDEVLIKFPQIECTMFLTERQAKNFIERLMHEVMRLPPKNPFACDKTKGDAFEALRKAEES